MGSNPIGWVSSRLEAHHNHKPLATKRPPARACGASACSIQALDPSGEDPNVALDRLQRCVRGKCLANYPIRSSNSIQRADESKEPTMLVSGCRVEMVIGGPFEEQSERPSGR